MDRAIGPDDAEAWLVLAPAAQRRLQLLQHKGLVVGMDGLLPGLAGALKVLGPQAVELNHHGIPGEDVVGHIPVPDADHAGAGGGLHVAASAHLVGDVVVDAHHPQGLSVAAKGDVAARADVVHRAVGPDDAELTVVGRAAGECGVERLDRAGAIVGMHRLLPLGVGDAALIRGQAVKAEHHRIPGEPVAGHIPVPDPHHAGAGGGFQVGGLGHQFRDVGDLTDQIAHRSIGVAVAADHQRPPDGAAVRATEAFAQAVLLQLAALEPGGQLLIGLQIVGMGELLPAAAEQLVLAAPKEGAQGVVDGEEASGLGITEAHAHPGAAQDGLEAGFGLLFRQAAFRCACLLASDGDTGASGQQVEQGDEGLTGGLREG